MGENKPQESITLASPNPHAEPQRRAARPTLSGDSERHFKAALDAGTRAGSSLSELERSIAELHSGITVATDVSLHLGQELTALGAVLEATSEQQRRLALRVTELEAELAAAERERRFLIAQQDEFLAALLAEHELELRARDEAVASASKLTVERDELRAEASQLRASLGVHRPSTSPPPPTSGGRVPSFLPAPPPLRLDAGELDSTLHSRSLTPLAPTASEFPHESTRPGVGGPKPSDPPPTSVAPAPAWTPAPPAPDTAVTRSPWPVSAASLPPGAAQALPILKRKPDPTTRPLIDYSLGEGGVQSETLEGAKLRSSKPPRK